MQPWFLRGRRADISRGAGAPLCGVALCLALALRHGLGHAQATARPVPSPGALSGSGAPEAASSPVPGSPGDPTPTELAAGSGDPTSMTFGDIETVTVDTERAPFESRDIIGSVTIIGKDQIANESVNEPLDLLRKLPGVHTEQYNQGIISSDVGVRGFNSQGDVAPLKLLIDGIPSNIHEGVADLKPIFPLDIERIEIVRGTADPRYGLYAVAGSLHVDTRRGGNGTVFRGVAGSFDTFEAQATSAFENERVSQNLFGGFRYSDGYREHSELQKYALSGKWYYKFDERLRLGVVGRLFRMDANAPGYLTTDVARNTPRASPWASRTDGGIQHNRHGSVHLDWDLGDETFLSVKGYHQRVRRQRWVRFTEANDQQERVQVEKQSGALSQISWEPRHLGPLETLSVTVGADIHYQDNFAARHQTDNDRNRVASTRGQDFDLINYGAFAQIQVEPALWWGVSAGLRWDRFDGEFTDLVAGSEPIPMLDFGNVLQPKVAAFVTPLHGYHLYANYGRSAQLPIREGLYSTANLTWSKNDGWEVGIRLEPLRWLNARVAYFRQSASDEVRELFSSTTDFENVGETLRQGLDSELLVSPLPELSLWVSYTYQRAERANPGPNLAALRGTELNHVPRYLLKTGADVRPLGEALVASVWLLSQGDYSLSNSDNLSAISPSTRVGGYSLAYVDVNYTAGNITLGGHVRNIFDTRWNASMWNDGSVTLTNPGDGRTFLASIETAF
jgi:iron complex outermembrane receptor protein